MSLGDGDQVKTIPKGGESKGKGPAVKVHLACLQNSEEGSARWGEE